MSIQSTSYFVPRKLAPGEIAAALRSAITPFARDPDSVHFALSRDLTSEFHESTDPASWSDVEQLDDLGAEGLLLRAWFDGQGNARHHVALGAETDTTRMTVATPSVDMSEQLLSSLASALGLEETESPSDRLQAALEEARTPQYDFTSIVSDRELAELLALRWNESYLTYHAGAYLSTLILLGSILEGVLLDKVEQNPSVANQAQSAPSVKGKVLQFQDWTLENFIAVSHECGWIDRDVRDFSASLRDYRNLVHPSKQRKAGVIPDSGTCNVAREVVRAALEDLIR